MRQFCYRLKDQWLLILVSYYFLIIAAAFAILPSCDQLCQLCLTTQSESLPVWDSCRWSLERLPWHCINNSGDLFHKCISIIRLKSLLLRTHCQDKSKSSQVIDYVPKWKFNQLSIIANVSHWNASRLAETRRTTRSPDRIQRWKNEFSSELASFSRVLPVTSCHSALHDLCLRHISCRELWKIFRQTCVVDAQNECKMTSRSDCWQAFEGISWTGLGTCSCTENNSNISDCQFIRLQTNYNKCIYEIKSSGNIPIAESPSGFRSRYFSTTTTTSSTVFAVEAAILPIRPDAHVPEMLEGRPREVGEQETRILEQAQRRRQELMAREGKEKRRQEATEFARLRQLESERRRLGNEAADWANRQRQHQQALQRYEKQIRERERQLDEARQRMLEEEQVRQNAQLAVPPLSSHIPVTTGRPASHTVIVFPPTQSPTIARPIWHIHNTKATIYKWLEHAYRTPPPIVEDQSQRMVTSGSTRESIFVKFKSTSTVGPTIGNNNKKSASKGRYKEFTTTTTPVFSGSSTTNTPKHLLRLSSISTTTISIITTLSPSSTAEIFAGDSVNGTEKNFSKEENSEIELAEKSAETMQANTTNHKLVDEIDEILESQLVTPPTSSRLSVSSSTLAASDVKRQNTTNTTQKSQSTRPMNALSSANNWHGYKTKVVVTRKSPYGLAEADNTRQIHDSHAESTCPEAHRRCEDESETCRWHLSELQMKCPTDHRRCAREQCAKALGRFSRYVPKGMVESLMFCQCAIGDSECKRLQWMYPRCLYSYTRNRPRHSCTEIMVLCENDALCARQFKLYNNSCQISSTKQDIITQFSASLLASTPRCVAPKMDACRVALIGVRGSFLETPCFCENEDAECFARQAMILPNTPCIEAAMMDYATRNGATTSGERRRASKTRLVQPTRDAATETIQNDDRAGAEVTLMSNLEREDAEETDEENRDLMKEKYEIVDMEHDGSAPLQNRTNTSLDVMEIDLSEATESNITEELLHEDRGENFVGVMTTSSTMISLTDSSAKTSPATSVALVEKKATAARRRPPLTALRRAGAGGLPTGAYVTQRPPPAGGCSTRNIDGEWIVHYKDSLFRHYDDWSGRCSSWCECSKAERMKCHELGCLVDVHCEAPHATVGFGERLYLEGRGACQCQSGKFICDTSEESLDLAPGLYISLGYSKEELSLLKSKVPKIHLEKSGLVSPAASVAKDIASRLQFALERVLPKGTLCRITLLEHFQQESIIIYQVQYYGVNHFANETQPKWHIGRLEKLCAQYVQELAHNFLLEKVDRYQLVLSTVKQLRVIDSLNGLPFTATPASPAPSAGAILRLNVVLAATIFACSISIMGQFSP